MFGAKISYEKRAHKTLMKLTVAAHPVFANELKADAIDSSDSDLCKLRSSSTGVSKRLSKIWANLCRDNIN
jgi:hypothetical protein